VGRLAKSLLLTAALPAVIAFGCNQRSAFYCEITLLLPATSVDPADQRTYARLTINGQEVPEATRLRAFNVKLKTARDSVNVTYSFWPKTYTNVVRTRVVPVEAGKPVQIDLTQEDPANPDQIRSIFVSTPMPVVDELCRLANVGPKDIVYDIGCGDGRMVISAVAKFGAKNGVGFDIDPDRIQESRMKAEKAGVLNKIVFRVQDALTIKDLSEATVVMMFVGEDLNRKLRPMLQETLKPGARIVSHHFDMGEWKPDKSEKFMAANDEGVKIEHSLYLWRIK
jgi:predicted RNA methylase